MGEYTSCLSTKGYDISPEDENYKQELLDVVKSFRTFDAALDEFIVQKGYSGDIAEVDAKVKFIKEEFDKAGIPIETRILRGWFQKHTQADKREIAIKFCFAFQLTLEETQDFFRRVYLQRDLDCHNIQEAIYYYCICHHLTYSEAQALIAKAPSQNGKGPVDFSADVLYTGTIIRELNRFQSPEELLAFLTENSGQFGYNNATAKRYINGLWQRIAGENGLASREIRHCYSDEALSSKQRSVWDIYLQIFGLLDFEEIDGKVRVIAAPLAGDRTFQTILEENELIHPIVRKCFPDRQGLEDIIKGKYRSDEVVRKTLILLAFYRFWVELLLKGKTAAYIAEPDDAPRCIASINRFLLDASYPELYEGNPYDWIFMVASYDSDPLNAFRSFISEVYLNKDAPCGGPQ